MAAVFTSTWSLPVSLVALVTAAGAILWAGIRLAGLSDRLADRLGLGEALFGAVFLGGSTSLPGVVTSIAAAAAGHPELAVSNALGGITVQFLFLAVADLSWRQANLEHASADLGNMVFAALLGLLLLLPLLAALGPDVALHGVHPVSPLILVAYWAGLRLVRGARAEPMWHPRTTRTTREDVPAPPGAEKARTSTLWARFAAAAIVTALGGWVISRAGISLVARTGLGEGVVGTLLTGVITSGPELVTTLAAVRRGALVLAVGGIVGGNAFDVLFLPLSDVAFRPGSLYHAVSRGVLFQMAEAIAMTLVVLLGLLRRERSGPWNVGFEGALLILVYVGGLVVLGR